MSPHRYLHAYRRIAEWARSTPRGTWPTTRLTGGMFAKALIKTT